MSRFCLVRPARRLMLALVPLAGLALAGCQTTAGDAPQEMAPVTDMAGDDAREVGPPLALKPEGYREGCLWYVPLSREDAWMVRACADEGQPGVETRASFTGTNTGPLALEQVGLLEGEIDRILEDNREFAGRLASFATALEALVVRHLPGDQLAARALRDQIDRATSTDTALDVYATEALLEQVITTAGTAIDALYENDALTQEELETLARLDYQLEDFIMVAPDFYALVEAVRERFVPQTFLLRPDADDLSTFQRDRAPARPIIPGARMV